MIDAHAHPSLSLLPSHTIFVSSCVVSDWEKWLVRQNEKIKVGIGIHPWFVENEKLSIPTMRKYLIDNPKKNLMDNATERCGEKVS